MKIYLYFLVCFLTFSYGFKHVEVRNMSIVAIVPGGYGHMYPVVSLLEELASRGHEVHLFTGESMEFPFPKSIQLHRIPQSDDVKQLFGKGTIPDWKLMPKFLGAVNDKRIVEMLYEFKDTHPVDILISDFMCPIGIGVGKKWGVPTISVHFTLDQVSIPNSYTPSGFSSFSPRSMSISERMIQYMSSAILPLAFQLILSYSIDEMGLDIFKPAELVLVPAEFGLLTPTDIPPFVKVIGPLFHPTRYTPNEEIEQLIQFAVEQDKKVIYVSFGTVGFIPDDRIPVFINALSQLNDSIVIWAITNEASRKRLPEQLPSNIYVKGHVPQLQLLNNSAVKLFISHCGANSANEAAFHGVPVLAIPLFADQPRYAKQLTFLNMAELVDSKTFTEDEIVIKVRLLLEGNYKKEAEKVSRLLTSSGGIEEAAWHVERLGFVGVHDYFVPERYNVNWIVKNHVDIWINFGIIIYIMYKVCSFSFGFCCRKQK